MSIAVTIMVVTATVEFVVGAGSLALGWVHFRALSMSAIAAGCYALVDMVYVTDGVADATVISAGKTSLILGLTSVGALAVYHRIGLNKGLGAFERAALGIMAVIGLAAAISPWGWGEVTTRELTLVGVTWRGPAGPWPSVASVAILVVMGRMVAADVRALAVQIDRRAVVRLLGFGLFFVAMFAEAMAIIGWLPFPASGDLGFMAIIVSTGFGVSQRVIDDSRNLRVFNQQLEEEASHRSRDLSETREALLLAERHSAIGRLAAGVGHEINNPLTFILANVEYAKESLETKNRARFKEEIEALDDALGGAERVRKIVSDLMAFTRDEPSDYAVANAGNAANVAVHLVSTLALL